MKKKYDDVLEKIQKLKIIPVLAVPAVEDGIKICGILKNAGLPLAEITFRTEAAEETIREVSEKFPDVLVGAGTVLNAGDLERAANAGAKFAVAPGCNPSVVRAAAEIGIPFFPGVATPTDIECACDLGSMVMKFFPCEPLGGLAMLKSLIAPYRHLGIKFIPLGGIGLNNMRKYLELKEIIAIGGTWIAKQELITAKQWDMIDKNVREALSLMI